MILPSQRQQSSPRGARDWTLHRRLARGRDRHRHLLLSAGFALLMAVVTWALGLDLMVRAAAVVAAAAVAWLVPVRGSDAWAMRWIGERAGLAYQTVIELDAGTDRYGLREALEERAGSSLERLEQPRHSAWWLPLLALALGALLLPALPLGPGNGGFAGGPVPPGGTSQSPAGTGDQPSEEEPTPNLPDQERVRVPGSASESRQGEAGAESEAGGDAQAGERDALERYLRNIRERPQAAPEEPEEGPGDSSRGPGGEPREGANERRDSGSEGESGENEAGPQGGQPGSEGEEEGESDEGGGEQESQNPFSPAGVNEEPGETEQADETGEMGEDSGGEEIQPEEGQADNGQPEGAAGAQEPGEGGEEDGRGQGAGGQGSPEQAAGMAGDAGEEVLQLEGDLGSGPLSSGGTIQLPGGDEVELPPGRSPETYTREVERAVTEGRVPLEYQEIIRNYFR
ncbi:MAG: hypothetical protein WD273_09580 [Trueperaceae bacterium]